jgi:DnaJ family protein C protein 28
VSEKLKRAYDEAERRMADMMQQMHVRGELRHLHGKPLELEEDDPAWLATRMLKQEGFSHPLLERRQDVQKQLQAADARIDRLLQRRNRLMEEQATTSPEAAIGFNNGRRLELEEYKDHLAQLNRTIRDYNLTVPTAIQIHPIQVDRQMERVEGLVPMLEPETFGQGLSNGSWWSRFRGERRS